ncbi:hypothetical protein HNQ80_004088 [Anaerosolibacter carboniphilus]|uniref:LysM domain-containing protein n=1 Tax=Anaerosolibacter carboniphilus TaxID=1417629 RepID=A0A841KWX9_9FIRM|nr:LysM peptidoglycan-binding domain-containing protein [Anaerosolibacter carboniphilus]MBB6217951.1 hypothetical protein [Anaerosolibacter carboniphilus]
MKKKIYVANKSRFSLSILILAIVISLSCILLLKLNIAEGAVEQQYYEMCVKSGDTLWSLAKQCTPNHKDVRKTIYEISQLNHLSTPDIYPGQIIKIPIQE